MDRSKKVKARPKYIRTLNLPRDFQLVLRRRDVRKVDADSGFGVRHRLYPGFWLAVKSAWHTARAFAKYCLLRLKRYLEKLPPTRVVWIFRQCRRYRWRILYVAPLAGMMWICFFLWFSLVRALHRLWRKLFVRVAVPDVNPVRHARFGERGYDPAIRSYRRVPRPHSMYDSMVGLSDPPTDAEDGWDL